MTRNKKIKIHLCRSFVKRSHALPPARNLVTTQMLNYLHGPAASLHSAVVTQNEISTAVVEPHPQGSELNNGRNRQGDQEQLITVHVTKYISACELKSDHLTKKSQQNVSLQRVKTSFQRNTFTRFRCFFLICLRYRRKPLRTISEKALFESFRIAGNTLSKNYNRPTCN